MVVTIHDLLWHSQRGTNVTTLNPGIYWFKYLFYRCITRLSMHKTQKIFVPSETIKTTIVSYYPAARHKVVVTKEGVELPRINLQSISEELKAITKKPFLLYVGSLYPHKNIELVLKTLQHDRQYHLVISGSRSVFQDEVKKRVQTLDLQSRVHFTGYISDESLTFLYTKAAALIQPSFSEGFGLTGIEALAVGTPVLASDIPVFREIYKDFAIYFDPHSVDACLSALHQLGGVKKDQLNAAARMVKREYNWQNMTATTLAVYQSIDT